MTWRGRHAVLEEAPPGFARRTGLLIAAHSGRMLHVMLDNLNTHKKNEAWLARHPQVSFHFTPASASRLNQVGIWFSILQAKSLRGASSTSVDQLRTHIDDFIKTYNAHSRPLACTQRHSTDVA